MQTTHGYLELDGGRLYYETAGSGEALVLSHAAFLDGRMFDAQWEQLARHFHVIRYDMRGYGQSSAVNEPVCRRDDLKRLLEHLNVQQAHFVGCSNGGMIALDLLLEQPSLVRSLIVIGSAPSGFEMQGEPPHQIMDMIGALQQGNVELANELQIRIWLDSSSREPEEMDQHLRQKALQMNRNPVERNTFMISDMQPACPLNPPAVERLQEIQCPVLIVAGALDHSEVLRAADLMEQSIPNARKIIIAGTGHVPSYEQPETVTQLILDFLVGQER
jgi:pimeloyl-ACP methyl ester carboxylesterase